MIQLCHDLLVPVIPHTFIDLDQASERRSIAIGDFYDFEGFLYEIWCFLQKRNIDEVLSDLKISQMATRSGKYLTNVPDPFKNSHNQESSKSCTDLSLSCNSEDISSCIPTYNQARVV